MKKLLLIFVVLLFIVGCDNNQSTHPNNVNTINKIKSDIEDSRNFETSLNNGSVIMISEDNNKKLSVYNINILDEFIRSFNNKNQDYIRIIKGSMINGEFLVNKVEELECHDNQIKLTPYDPYSNREKFIAGTPNYFVNIKKLNFNNGIRYVLLDNTNTSPDMALTLISFDKEDIKK